MRVHASLLLLFAAGAVSDASGDVQARGWSTCESYTPADGSRHAPFEISCWGDDGRHLYATFTYDFARHPGDPPVATLHGRQDGAWFRPNVRLQVRRGRFWPWVTVGDTTEGEQPLCCRSADAGAGLHVQLDAFRPYLGKRRYGRVVLESGESAEIYLDDLLRPERQSHNGPNQAMQLTASKPDVHVWGVCRRVRMLRGVHRGLAAADLVSR